MNNFIKSIKTLELNKILLKLSAETDCIDAAKATENISPETDLSVVNVLLKETNDAYMLTGRFGSPQFYGLSDVKDHLTRAKAGGMLSMGEILNVLKTLKALRNILSFKKQINSEKLTTSIDWRFDEITANKDLEQKIEQSILSEEEMSDTASAELGFIRRRIKSASNKIRAKLDNIISSSTYQKYLMDPIVTIRDNRFVVPVKLEYRDKIPGIVHDTSSSGATLFIEPMVVVEANNEIRILKSKERDEIERILFEISSEVGDFSVEMIKGYTSAVELNVIFAKAKLAYSMKASLPLMNDRSKIKLNKARHPLIEQDKVVPIDIEMGTDFDTLVITGPNTGGKTVSLKTVGLLTLMAMCGLMIPAYNDSELSVFDNVLCDIGDEQSIEQSLSTFSAHIKNVVDILKKANNKSLILLDELGAGTDPVEGAALAISILEDLRKKGCKVIATTHYSELKFYALSKNRVENGSCEFDIQTLRPTYRLLIGIPGSSNAFAICERLGIEKAIVDSARELLSSDDLRFEDVVKKIEISRQKLENELKNAENIKLETEKLKKETEKMNLEIKSKYNLELENARVQARNIVSRTKAEAQSIVDELEVLKKKGNAIDNGYKSNLKKRIRLMEEKSDPVKEKMSDKYNLPRKLKAGDSVLIFDLDKKATVLEPEDNSGNILVQAGIIKTRVPVKNLRLLHDDKVKVQGRSVTKNVKSGLNMSKGSLMELDVRGMNALDALMELDKFIDSCILSEINNFTIIHGKGLGILKKEIHKHLKTHPAVKIYRLGVFGEGESGVTIVELK